MSFKDRLLVVKSDLAKGNKELAFKEINSLVSDMFDDIQRPLVSEEEVKGLCQSLNQLAVADYTYSALEPLYHKMVFLSLAICKPQVLSDIFLEMAEVHYALGLLDNTILLATKACHYASQCHITKKTKAQHYLIWLEHTLAFEALGKYYASLTPSEISALSLLKSAENTFILLLSCSQSTNNYWLNFYQRNQFFLTKLVEFTQSRILTAMSDYRLKEEGAGLVLEKVLCDVLELLKAFLKFESILQEIQEDKKIKAQDKGIEAFKYSWALREYLAEQLRGLTLPESYSKTVETKFKFLKDKFRDTHYWITSSEGHEDLETVWQVHQGKLKEIRATYLQQSAKDLFSVIGNYRHALFELFKTYLADPKESPCEWELCLRGSYARGDIHGYSDLDVFLLIDKNELQLHPYFQMFITSLHHCLLGMGDDWEWMDSSRGKDLTRDIIESGGLSIDSGDREHLLVDYPRINLSKFTPEEKEKYLKKKLYLISTPEELASWVIGKITQKDIDEDYLAAFSLLQGQEVWHFSQGEGLLKRYHDILQKSLTKKQIQAIGEQRLLAGLKGDEFKKLKPEDVSQRLKNYLQLLNLVMICIYYCHKQKLSLPAFSFESWQKELSGYWHPGFLGAWLSTWQKLHTWRFLYQQKNYQRKVENNDLNNNNAPQGRHSASKVESDVLVRDLSVEQQKELRVIYETLLVPFFETLSPGDRFIFHPWQAYAQGYVSKKKDPTFLAHFLQILSTAREAGAGIKLTSSHIQPIWESVSNELMTVWVQKKH